ncbi:MAG: TRAP transporter large permease subunit [Candidatus Accumulibacter sp.]|jgi:C4-dicarboxylate transporter DctM subunit|nr:TRAP transporter large permease subunit [Accumulibacter sp.]
MPLSLLIVIFGIVLFIGLPLGVALTGIAILPGLFQPSFPYTAESAVRSLSGGMDSFLLLAIPLFMFSGVIMAKGGISEKLFDLFAYFFGNLTAGFPMAVVITCLFYGAISGSAPATTAAVGSMSIPFLVKRGYDPVFASALVAVSGGLGVIIPPSIPMIAYSTISSVSVADMFIAGILPGLLIAGCLMIYALYYCKKKGEDKEKLHAYYMQIHRQGFLILFKGSFFALLTPIIILGSIYGGIATPTEAASLSVYYALIVSLFVYKTIKIRDIPTILCETVKTYAPILFVIACAVVLSRVITLLQISRMVEQAVLANVSSKVVILLLINIILLIAGMFMDAIPAMMIFTPIVLPLVKNIGMSPVHLGIVMIVNLAVGFVTPPVGVNLFVASNMTGISVLSVAKAALPFIAAFLVALLLITFIPAISLSLI